MQGSSAAATRSCSWSHVVHGDKQCELRPTCGLRGVQVGETSHIRSARRMLSTQVDSENFYPEDPTIRSGRFAPLSSDSDDSPNVHVCRASTNGAILAQAILAQGHLADAGGPVCSCLVVSFVSPCQDDAKCLARDGWLLQTDGFSSSADHVRRQ